eukprot:m.103112 g.103112  ORF g.103112 m.103112 type:complete len:713 (-) comp27471_c0_seq1:70-2208(-)
MMVVSPIMTLIMLLLATIQATNAQEQPCKIQGQSRLLVNVVAITSEPSTNATYAISLGDLKWKSAEFLTPQPGDTFVILNKWFDLGCRTWAPQTDIEETVDMKVISNVSSQSSVADDEFSYTRNMVYDGESPTFVQSSEVLLDARFSLGDGVRIKYSVKWSKVVTANQQATLFCTTENDFNTQNIALEGTSTTCGQLASDILAFNLLSQYEDCTKTGIKEHRAEIEQRCCNIGSTRDLCSAPIDPKEIFCKDPAGFQDNAKVFTDTTTCASFATHVSYGGTEYVKHNYENCTDDTTALQRTHIETACCNEGTAKNLCKPLIPDPTTKQMFCSTIDGFNPRATFDVHGRTCADVFARASLEPGFWVGYKNCSHDGTSRLRKLIETACCDEGKGRLCAGESPSTPTPSPTVTAVITTTSNVPITTTDEATTPTTSTCPEKCGSPALGGGTCKNGGQCTSCDGGKLLVKGYATEGGYFGQCKKSVVCKGLKLLTVSMLGSPCKCADKSCHWCVREAAGDVCKKCKANTYLLNGTCVDACPTTMVSVGNKVIGRKCVSDPFVCFKGKTLSTKTPCTCSTRENKKAPTCAICDFEVGGWGQKCTQCTGGMYLNPDTHQCDVDCSNVTETAVGIVAYKVGPNKAQCREPFTCRNGVDEAGLQCKCSKNLGDCVTCDWGHKPNFCTVCGNKKYLKNGVCVRNCGGLTAVGTDVIGRECQ